MVLLERRGVTREEFARLHPSGNLGRILLLRVTDIMRSDDRFPQLEETATIQEAIEDPQVRAMGYLQPMEHAQAGPFETVGTPFRIEGETLGAGAAAPPVDRDGRAIRQEAGIAEDEIDKLLS